MRFLLSGARRSTVYAHSAKAHHRYCTSNVVWRPREALPDESNNGSERVIDRPVRFDSPRAATAGKTTWEVFRGWLVFKLFTFDYLVDNSMKLYGISTRLLGRWLTGKLMRATVFGQFAGGVEEDEVARTVQRLAKRRISSVWQYSTEQDISEDDAADLNEDSIRLQEEAYDGVAERYLRDIEMSGACNYDGLVKFTALKMTPIINPNLLMKVNGKLVELLENLGTPSCQNEAFFQHISAFQNSPTEISGLSEVEKEQMRRFVERITSVAECARSSGVRVMVDAEQTYFQTAIHHYAVFYLMPLCNTHSAVVYDTLQTYLMSALNTLQCDLAAAKRLGFKYGVKMVRGAYMEQERKVAEQSGRPSPIHPDKPATDESCHAALQLLLGAVSDGTVEMVIGSHNQRTVELALNRMKDLGISPQSGKVAFGQLLGMGDHLTYPLARTGYCANKIVPYGSMDDVAHYLSRRGNENRGLIRNAQVERTVYWEEIKRRILSFK